MNDCVNYDLCPVLTFDGSHPKQVSIEGHRMIKQSKLDILFVPILLKLEILPLTLTEEAIVLGVQDSPNS